MWYMVVPGETMSLIFEASEISVTEVAAEFRHVSSSLVMSREDPIELLRVRVIGEVGERHWEG